MQEKKSGESQVRREGSLILPKNSRQTDPELLYSLHELRKDANYETEKIIRKEDVERVITYVKEVKTSLTEYTAMEPLKT